jgi:CelD/BcsL family acetyltransferase involved in cellulose biosynthesis
MQTEAIQLLCDTPKLATTVAAQPATEVFEGGAEVIERLADEWRALCAEGPCDQPFYWPEWVATYLRAFAPERKVLLFTARVAGRLRAVLPLIQEWALFHGLPVRKLRSAANVHSCRYDLVHGAGDEVETVARAVWQMLRQRRGWDVIQVCDVPQGGACESLLRAAESDGYPTGQWKQSPGPYITLPGDAKATLDQALAHTGSKFRSSIRRKRRKLGEEGELRLRRITEALPAELELFYQLENAGWKGQHGTAIACDRQTRQFYDEVARRAAQVGYFLLYRLDCGERAVALQYGLSYGESFFLLKPTYDEHFRQASPGHVIMHEILRDMLARGQREFDFLMPVMEWKREWATGLRPHSICYIFARNHIGRALHAYRFRLLMAARQVKRKWTGMLSDVA